MKYISLTFDDGRKDNFEYAYPIMQKYGLVGTVYCTTGYIDGSWQKPNDWASSGDAISLEELRILESDGWEIGLHGDKHTTDVQDMWISLEKMKEWGFVKQPIGFSMPNSTIEKEKLDAVINEFLGNEISYIRTGRRIDTKKISSKLLFGMSSYGKQQLAYNRFNRDNINQINSFNKSQVYSVVIRNSDDPKIILKYIDQLPDNTWVVFMLHSVLPTSHELHATDPWNWSTEKFTYFCSGLKVLEKRNKIRVKTAASIIEQQNIACEKHFEKMESVQNKVIVWSIDDFNTLGLMRELGQFGLDLTFLIKGSAGMATKSKYCKKYIETGSIEEGMSYLINTFGKETVKPIIIISSDEIVTYVDLHREELKDLFILPVTSEKGNVAKYIDKNTMTDLAEKLGILCPQSRFIKWDSPIDDINYPCLIKPSHQKPGHYNEFKFKICKNEKSLKRTLAFVRHDSEFILQQYIPKELDLLIYGARMRDGKTVTAGAMIRDRWADSGSSSHGFLTSEIPECADVKKVACFLDKIDYYGPFSVEYGIVGDKAYFFEINLRNDGTSHYFFQAGANIPLAYVYSCAGLDYSTVSTTVGNKAYFIDEVFDIENLLLKRVTKSKWKADYENATIFKYYDKDDLEPWIQVKKTRTKQILQDFVLKRYRLYIVAVLDRIGFHK